MKTKIFFIICSITLCSYSKVIAQNWTVGGNTLSADSKFGSKNAFDVLFTTNNAERGRITDAGLWGIGATAPNSKFHINSSTGQDGLRVQINSSTKLLVHSGGGVSIGSVNIPPANGLYVAGNAGIGTTTPNVKLHVAGGSDVNPGSGGFIVAGSVTGANIAIDDNEIMARNNSAGSTLFLNNSGGGNLVIDATNSGSKVGIGVSSPAYRLHVTGSGTTAFVTSDALNPQQAAFKCDVTPFGAYDTRAIWGRNMGTYGYGGYFEGNFIAIDGHVTNSTAGTGYGTSGVAEGGSSNYLYGAYGRANNGYSCYGVYGTASGGSFNYAVYANGNMAYTGTLTHVSDEKLKKNIQPFEEALEKIMQLKPSTFVFLHWKLPYLFAAFV